MVIASTLLLPLALHDSFNLKLTFYILKKGIALSITIEVLRLKKHKKGV